MNTSEAKLLLFLGSSYSVNQKRKPKKKKKGKIPTERSLESLADTGGRSRVGS